MPVTHKIKIAAAARGEYQTTGAVSVLALNPMKSAAQALLGMGHDPADRLRGIFEGSQISAVRLSRLAAPYRAPRTDHRARDVGRNCD
jgi:hypothetical protein